MNDAHVHIATEWDHNEQKLKNLEDTIRAAHTLPSTSSSSTKTAKLNKDVSHLLDQLQNLVSINFAQDVEHDTERLIKEVAKWICVVFQDKDRHDALHILIRALSRLLHPTETDERFNRLFKMYDELFESVLKVPASGTRGEDVSLRDKDLDGISKDLDGLSKDLDGLSKYV